jgi:hypothetical protein
MKVQPSSFNIDSVFLQISARDHTLRAFNNQLLQKQNIIFLFFNPQSIPYDLFIPLMTRSVTGE